MDVQTKKLELVQLILDTDRPALLDKIIQLLKQEKEADWWDEIPQNIKESIDIALTQDDNGETFSHEDVIREAKSKYKL
jgi:thiamine pyrophosphate-dependent acetolactate synthase large subunit-like protein